MDSQQTFSNIENHDPLRPIWLNPTYRHFGLTHHRALTDFSSHSFAEDKLHLEILKFYEYIIPTDNERFVHETCASNYVSILRSLPGVVSVELTGSYSTGLCLPTSDIDLVIMYSGDDPYNFLNFARDHLVFCHNVPPDCVTVVDARVKVISLTDPVSQTRIDMSLNKENAVRCREFVREQMHKHRALKYLVIAIKFLLSQNELNRAFVGGLGSYPLILLVLHFLVKQCPPQTHPFNLGRIFMFFLDYFGGNTFDHTKHQLKFSSENADEAFYAERSPHQQCCYSSSLSIIDPMDETNDVGISTFNFAKVKALFAYTYRKLKERLESAECVNSLLTAAFSVNPHSLLVREKLEMLALEIKNANDQSN